MSAEDLAALEVTDAQLAALAGVSPRRIRQLVEAGRLTRVGRNRYALGDAFAALLEEMSGGDKASELTAERVRKLRAEATMAELELAKAKGEVALIEEFEAVQRHSYGLIRVNMLNIPRRVVSLLAGESDERRITEVLTNEINQVLRDAAEQPVEIPEDE
ncbi:type IV toxin-antitoxin system AbiEi family antitoxin domain-containing protein [Azotobacter salinestris]|uniref:type IV toxin-antitoxin system AbiEi family antitoxin domain-containing protein n=1 Tax=Azotobacter salinestris TaxID=69964 RepID=UPI0032DF04FB